MSIIKNSKKIAGLYKAEELEHSTEHHAGIILIATQEEALEGLNDSKAVTPAKIHGILAEVAFSGDYKDLTNTPNIILNIKTTAGSNINIPGIPRVDVSTIDGVTTLTFNNLKGEKGETGALGPIGETGLQGPTGKKGDKGDTYTITLLDYTNIANEVPIPYPFIPNAGDLNNITLSEIRYYYRGDLFINKPESADQSLTIAITTYTSENRIIQQFILGSGKCWNRYKDDRGWRSWKRVDNLGYDNLEELRDALKAIW